MRYLIYFCFLYSSLAWGLDNPDAPNYREEFEARIAPLELYVSEQAITTKEFIAGYARLERALDNELNDAYENLMDQLSDQDQETLRKSQWHWIKYKESEFLFIGNVWNQENYGTSYVISVGEFRTNLIKSRIMVLLSYMKSLF